MTSTIDAGLYPAAGPTPTQVNADTVIQAALNQYGLGQLSQWAWAEITSGASADQVALDMYQQPAFKQRFPGIFQRQAAGLPAISPADYVTYESQAKELENAYGLPQGFLSQPGRIGNLIGGDVSMAELQDRVQKGYSAVATAPPEVRQAFSQMFGVNGDPALASYFLDSKTATPILEQQATAADIAGRAGDVGFGLGNGLDAQTAMRLSEMGVTGSSAQSQLGDLASKSSLFTQQAGEVDTLSKTQGLDAEFNLDAAAQQKMQQAESQRQAEFAGGGGAAVTTQGTTIGAAKPF